MGFKDWSKQLLSNTLGSHHEIDRSTGVSHSGNGFLSEPLESAKFVVVDTELTGLDEKVDGIISIGAVRMSGLKIDAGDILYRMVKPQSIPNTDSVTIHGITPEELEQYPPIQTVLPEFLSFIDERILVGYFPIIDLTFLNRELKAYLKRSITNPVVDVLGAFRWIVLREGNRQIGNPSLYEIAEELGVEVKDAHNAASDAFITAQVLQRMIPRLSELGVSKVSELLGISNPNGGGEDKFRYLS